MPVDETGHVNDRNQLEHLGDLNPEPQNTQPPHASVDGLSDPRDQNQGQQEQADEEQPEGMALPFLKAHACRENSKEHPQCDMRQLMPWKIKTVPRHLVAQMQGG